MNRITVIALSAALATGVAACSDRNPSGPDDTILNLPAGVVVSNPRTSSSTAGSVALRSSLGASASTVVYVSAVPGTFPGAALVAVRNPKRGGVSRSAQVIDGGFDPVGIEAEVGDELSLTISMTSGGFTSMTVRVPPRRPPTVVRTNPAKGRTDVALNVQVVVVFSEPVDASSVTASSIALLQGGRAVNGRVQMSADGLSAEFIPDSPLQPQTTYELVVKQTIRDLDGDQLADASTVPFTTEPGGAILGTIVVTSATTGTTSSDLDPDGYGVSIDGQPEQPLGVNGTVTIANQTAGSHAVRLSGVSENCTVRGPTTRVAAVVRGATTIVSFDVTCQPIPEPGGVLAMEGVLAFVSERDGNPEIYSINVDGTGLARMTNNAAADVDPAWSPDGKRIAFASDRDGSSAIYVMNADGSNVVRRTDAGAWNEAPAWSPDGRKIAFSSLRDGQFGIYVMNVDEDWSSPTRVGYDRGWNAHPAWSPDGSKIAFVSDWRAFDFAYDLYSMNADGSGITALILGPFFWPDNTYYFQPAWSPNGGNVAMVVCFWAWDNCYPHSSVAVANADGSGLKTLVNAGGFASPTWSPDGSIIAFSSSTCRTCGGSIRYVKADGSMSGLIFSSGYSPSWRP